MIECAALFKKIIDQIGKDILKESLFLSILTDLKSLKKKDSFGHFSKQ